MSFWRQAGLNYVRFSNVAAKVVRQSLKPELQADAAKREVTTIRFKKWVDGKPEGFVKPGTK